MAASGQIPITADITEKDEQVHRGNHDSGGVLSPI
jgi:hypothetical protein